MNTHQVAGRHGSFMTQFVRPARSRLPTRQAMLRANSRKAVNRRLVLPLDAHQWSRAFEVLGSRYARLGRTAEHYQDVVRDMAAHGKTQQERAGIVEALDRVREQAFAEEIPVSRSLWSTLVYAYCELDRPEEALEAFDQAQRRFTYSSATLQYMAELLLPVICRAGQYEVASQIVATHFSQDGKHSQHDGAAIQQWLAEAAARAGVVPDKVTSLLSPPPPASTTPQGENGVTSSSPSTGASASRMRTVHSLFMQDNNNTAPQEEPHHISQAFPLRTETLSSTRCNKTADDKNADALSRLSTSALRSLMKTACADPEVQLPCAIRCWGLLFGPWDSLSTIHSALPAPRLARPAPIEVREMLNALVVAGQWRDALELFARVFLGCGAEPFLAEASQINAPARETLFDLPESARGPLRYGDIPLDEITLNLIFSAFPHESATVAVAPSTTSPAPPRSTDASLNVTRVLTPTPAVRLLDVLLWHRDDAELTDRMMVIVASALIQLGQLSRAAELLQRTPAFDMRPGKKVDMRVPSEPSARAVREQLCSTVYFLHACTTAEMRIRTLQQFPFLFPPEVFRHLPPPEELKAMLAEMQATTTKSAAAAGAANDTDSDEARLAALLAAKTPTSIRPSRHHYFPARATSVLTESQEAAMQRDFVRLLDRKEEAFHGSHADADKDPRPMPKGLHDHASGWDFFGRGGEMVFANHRRTPHLLSMRPKVMRALADPYRSWNPKLNSSLAHKENVLKWNGKSAV